jgi:hypothetical protein
VQLQAFFNVGILPDQRLSSGANVRAAQRAKPSTLFLFGIGLPPENYFAPAVFDCRDSLRSRR